MFDNDSRKPCYEENVKDIYEQLMDFVHIKDGKTISSNVDNDSITIGTHDGRMHADDIAACTLISLYIWLDNYINSAVPRERIPRNICIYRTRKIDLLNELDWVVDVGYIYSPGEKRFDHHQDGFYEVFSSEHDIKLSSVGLIWKNFGMQLIKLINQYGIRQYKILNRSHDSKEEGANIELSKKQREFVYNHIYNHYIVSLDADDNGIDPINTRPMFDIFGTTFPTTVSIKSGAHPNYVGRRNVGDSKDKFKKLMAEYLDLFLHQVGQGIDVARKQDNVTKLIFNTKAILHDGAVILSDNQYTWEAYLDMIENTLKKQGYSNQLLYIIYPRQDRNNTWGIYALPSMPGFFKLRKPMPKAWRGKSQSELNQLIGVNDMVMVHVNGFLGIANSKNTILRVAELAINEPMMQLHGT